MVTEGEAFFLPESALGECNRTVTTICVIPLERLGDPVTIVDTNSDFVSTRGAPPIALRNRALDDDSVPSGDIVCRTVNARSVAHHSNRDLMSVFSEVVNCDVTELERLI
ncbi:hypothetical protein [Haloferax volcanii]|uniref:Uncharacterized protein n=1 Tax=Haloferax lucentense (strain DSM 14919 / JCM 9276 / NCIMB 13854 / Aa 2.2) TaxID=1230452 RepID=M0H5A0_HALL2|nr:MULTISPECIES: hypothetical protein [Haloferax]ELZ78912.1 hypothetical protein C456_01282 [Haloferax lucentense DSM 14919]